MRGLLDWIIRKWSRIATYKSALAWTIVSTSINIAGNVLPFLLTVLFYAVATKIQPDGIHHKDGQFYLYAASLLTSSAFIYFEFKRKVYDRYALLFGLCCSLLAVASVIYAFQLAGTEIESTTIFNSSLGIFAVSVMLFFFANLSTQAKVDVQEVDHENIDNVMKEMPSA